ncbi:restriction endonuclease subunit S [Staphylococcus nepalensis]|uniref:restriction endonuclease subunit S n=1 Tax=Staphylococcus nepalensis TaxID=214473 RepID=UPI000E692983|nr:restriction endonuclease subunit S [Staphylococcus nepalensis]RIO44221.1 restriction endonuclease subunit S [Staphylococcus nepalensis]
MEYKVEELIESISKTHTFPNNEIIFLNTSDIEKGYVLHRNYSETKSLPGQAKKSIQKGDILYSEIRPKNERYAYIDFECENYVVSTKLMVLRNKKPKTLNTRFFYLYITSRTITNTLQNLAESRSGTFPQITFSEVKKLQIKLPNLTVQNKIVKTIESINQKIVTNQKIIANLEELSQTLFKRWFVDFEFPDENGNPYKSSGGEMIDSELGIIPKLWNIKRLSDICIVTDGTHDSPKQTTEGYPLVTSKHLNKFDIDFSTTKLISKEDFTSINQRSKVEKNDILLSMIGTIGKLHFVNSNSINYAIKNVGLIKTSQIDYSTYIYNYINSQNTIDYIQQRTSGSTQQYISLKNLRSIPIISPTSNILKTYIDRNNNFFEKINQKIKENVKLIELRNTLLPKLMSGELEIPDDIEVNEDELSI